MELPGSWVEQYSREKQYRAMKDEVDGIWETFVLK